MFPVLPNLIKSILKGLWPFLLTVILVALGIWGYWEWELAYPSTKDAVLYNSVIPISAEISGTVLTVNVKDDQWVNQGDILFTLDDRQQKIDLQTAQNNLAIAKQTLTENEANLTSAKAMLASAKSDVDLQQAEFNRKFTLSKSGAISISDLEVAKQAFLASQANLQVTQAALDKAFAALGDPTQNTAIETANIGLSQAELNLSYTIIKAPTSGFLTNLNVNPGQRVTPNITLFGIIGSGLKTPFRIQAYILEPFLKNIRVGQPVTFHLRTYPDTTYYGIVSGIGYGINIDDFQSNQALPSVSASFNWISVAKRFPIMITVTSSHDFETHPFRIGASVALSIDTHANPSADADPDSTNNITKKN
jgi:membrane fusion protein (multidrug efflux system)